MSLLISYLLIFVLSLKEGFMHKGLFGNSSSFEDRYIPDYEKLSEQIAHFRALWPKGKIGFVSGVWDLIHLGHMAYIEAAHQDVDLLVVGVDTDELTRKRKKKGELDRPIVHFEERSRIIAHLRAVDLVTVVDEDFISVLEAVRPDKLVFSQTTTDMAPEARDSYMRFAGEIVLLPPQAPPDKVSTTARIRSIVLGGLDESEGRIEATVDEQVVRFAKDIKSGVRATFNELRSKL